jgi:hypothetical protein
MELANDLSIFESAFQELGIDKSRIDNDEPEVTEAPKPEQDAKAEVVEENKEESDLEHEQESDEVKPEGEETNEAPIEEPKLTAKEFQEIELAKTELATKQQAFQEEMQAKEKEFQANYGDKLKDYNQFDDFLAYYAEKDQDMFRLIQSDFQDFIKQSAHPMVEKFNQKVSDLEAKLSKFEAKASDEVVITKLNAEVEKVKNTIGKEAEAAGIKIDYKAVEDVWGNNPKLSFEEALWAKYGASLAKAQASKAKVATAESVVKARPVVATSGAVKKSNAPTVKDYSRMSYLDILKEEAKLLRA